MDEVLDARVVGAVYPDVGLSFLVIVGVFVEPQGEGQGAPRGAHVDPHPRDERLGEGLAVGSELDDGNAGRVRRLAHVADHRLDLGHIGGGSGHLQRLRPQRGGVHDLDRVRLSGNVQARARWPVEQRRGGGGGGADSVVVEGGDEERASARQRAVHRGRLQEPSNQKGYDGDHDDDDVELVGVYLRQVKGYGRGGHVQGSQGKPPL